MVRLPATTSRRKPAAAMNEVYREVVKPNPPARATVLLAPGSAEGLVEIMTIPYK